MNNSNQIKKPNMERISEAAYGIVSILKVLGPLNRHLSGDVPIEDKTVLEIANRNLTGGLQSALQVLATTILDLSEE